MNSYLRFELLRTVRNRQMFVFSIGMPVLLFALIALPNRHEKLAGAPFATYYMVGMIAWGSMAAVVAGGARIAMERSSGWNRQLRTTPLSPRVYLAGKIVCGYVTAAVTIGVMALAGSVAGVRLDLGQWIGLVTLTLVGLAPFSAMGIAFGHLLRSDTLGAALGASISVFGLLGGSWGPIASSGWLHVLGQALPSYWLVQAGPWAFDGGGWPLRGWLVVGTWTAAMVGLATVAYRRDTSRG